MHRDLQREGRDTFSEEKSQTSEIKKESIGPTVQTSKKEVLQNGTKQVNYGKEGNNNLDATGIN